MEHAVRVWKNVDAVCFDVDSTVIREEGIDELAKFLGKGQEIANMTASAMSGKMTFREALEKRLAILKPSTHQIREFTIKSSPTLSPGIKDLVNFLHANDIPVYLISGGFTSIITPIADKLNIPHSNIFANRFMFYYTGEFAGFDKNCPTSKNGGKAQVIESLKKSRKFKNLVLIGDGITDLEAYPPADAFIGYGGNVKRIEVQSKSEWYITDFHELIEVYNTRGSSESD